MLVTYGVGKAPLSPSCSSYRATCVYTGVEKPDLRGGPVPRAGSVWQQCLATVYHRCRSAPWKLTSASVYERNQESTLA